MVIVTADDFGISSRINLAVARSMTLGYATHTSVLVNLEHFDEAVELARSHGFSERVGLHLNLTSGAPLTERMRRSRYFCRDGLLFEFKRKRALTLLSREERGILADEVRTQLDRARRSGLIVKYLDSHNHSHIAPNMASVIVQVAKEFGITRVRPARYCRPGGTWLGEIYKTGYNWWLRRRGLASVRHFGTVDDLINLARRNHLSGGVEVMIHPDFNGANVLVDGPSGRLLDEHLARLWPACAAARDSDGAGG